MKKIITVTLIVLCAILYFYHVILPQNLILLDFINPNGLFDPIAEVQIKNQGISKDNIFEIKHKFVGTYLVGFYFENPSPYGEPIENCGKVILKSNFNSSKEFFHEYDDWRSRFGGKNDKKNIKSGVILGFYNVPEEIPRNKKLIFNLNLNQ